MIVIMIKIIIALPVVVIMIILKGRLATVSGEK